MNELYAAFEELSELNNIIASHPFKEAIELQADKLCSYIDETFQKLEDTEEYKNYLTCVQDLSAFLRSIKKDGGMDEPKANSIL